MDGIVNRLSELLVDYPSVTTKKMQAWSKVKNFWQRRASILCQLSLKTKTNEALLFGAIDASIGDDEFFIRKGLGWALRTYAKTNPEVVIDYVNSNRDRLSALSKKEALRILLKDGVIGGIP